jgi:hypothetical protein
MIISSRAEGYCSAWQAMTWFYWFRPIPNNISVSYLASDAPGFQAVSLDFENVHMNPIEFLIHMPEMSNMGRKGMSTELSCTVAVYAPN